MDVFRETDREIYRDNIYRYVCTQRVTESDFVVSFGTVHK